MPLTRLDNLYSSKTGKYLYVSPDDFNATDELDNRGNSPLRPFKTIQRAFIEVSRYSYLPGANNDRFDQFSIMLMPGNHYIDNRPGLVTETDVEARYFDAANLLEGNRQEVIDRAVAQVSVQHPDFYYPGDPQTGAWSRYKDAYRLIQKNRDELIDRATAEIPVAHPDFIYPGDPTEGEWSRYKDAYRLIQNNKDLIAQDAFDYMVANDQPSPLPDGFNTKCVRDIKFLIDAVSLDVHEGGGNKYTRKYIQNYFNADGTDWVDGGLRGEESSSLTAFAEAVRLMKLAITNNYTSTSSPGSEYQDLTVVIGAPNYETTPDNDVPNTDPTACSDVQTYIDNLYAVVDSIFNDADLAADNGNFDLSALLPAETVSDKISAGHAKCKRDTGFVLDALALDVHEGGGNRYTRKLLQNYFDSSGQNWVANGLQGETAESLTAFAKLFNEMKKAVTNQLYFKDLTITPGDAIYGNTNSPQENLPSGNPGACADVQTQIDTLGAIVTQIINDENLDNLPDETTSDVISAGYAKCKRDSGYIVDGLINDLRTEGNANTITNAKAYFDRFGNPIANGVLGEEAESITAFNGIATFAKQAVTNQLFFKDLTISAGPAYAGANTPEIPNLASGNAATCIDVQATIDTLIGILTDVIEVGNLDNLASIKVTGVLPSFNYNAALEEWQDNSIVDLANPDNVLYKFNAATGGCIVPRGCSLIGYDLRRTVVRPLYVPDPADTSQERTSIFNLTGGCYLWQFTIKDGDLSAQSPLYDASAGVGKVYYKKGSTDLAIPEYSHHKICIMTYADRDDLDNYYDKVGKSFQQFQPTIDDGGLEALVQENRIVGPLSDSRTIESIRIDDSATFTGNASSTAILNNVTNVENLEVGYEITSTDVNVVISPNTRIEQIAGTTVTLNQPIVGSGNVSFLASFGYANVTVTTKIDHGYFEGQYVAIINSGLSDEINGTWKVTAIDGNNPKVFEYEVYNNTAASLGLVSGQTYLSGEVGGVSTNAVVLAEIDSVESASPYVFNCSIRSTWGQCGMWADGSKATGFKSMVVAQYTGVSLQKDDRAFIRYDALTNTWNQASLTDAFATIPYHTKGDAYWKDDWRNFHIRASDDSFIQCVSVFAVGFFDHFLMESGGDMSITNSNSNFGNTSLHAVGFKGFAFNQDKGGYITDIVPVEKIDDTEFNVEQQKYYSLAIQPTKDPNNDTKLYYGADNAYDPFAKPATSINGYRLGALTNEKLYLNIKSAAGTTIPFNATLEPSGFKKYAAAIESLNPDGITINNNAQDAANLIEANKEFIQKEGYGYITSKYPALLTNTNITIGKCERDIGYFVDAVIADLRLGGNINTIKAAEGYYVGGQLAYIETELNESLDAYDYVKNLCIAAMRNFDYLIRRVSTVVNSPIVDIGDTSGIIVGMKVEQYNYPTDFTNGRLNEGATPITTQIPSGAYVRRIIDSSRIELGAAGSYLTTGLTVNASSSGNGAYVYFSLPQTASPLDSVNALSGVWSSVSAVKDPTVLQDTTSWGDNDPDGYPECSGIATTIQGYFRNISLILSQGLTPVNGRYADAANLLEANKDLIANEALSRMLDANPGFSVPGGNVNCLDDVNGVLDALIFNVRYGSNNKIYEAAELYVNNPDVVEGERVESVEVYTNARDIAIQVMRNEAVNISGTHGFTQFIDNSVIPDYNDDGTLVQPPCQDVASTITTLIAIITQSIGTPGLPGDLNGVTKSTPDFTTITREEPSLDTANLAARATLFTIFVDGATTNPHNFETGTPVRLVPKAKAGTNPDKRVIRLPKGFDTNTVYYVIAPGRKTQPENYSDFSKYENIFTSEASTKLMLATTKENAAAGIYIYSSETEAVDSDVEIELYQYVLDERYDLHQYTCNFPNGVTDLIQTDVPHIFDVPSSSDTVQAIFFRTFGEDSESRLPSIAGGDQLDPNTYYYARYSGAKTFSVHTTIADAIAGVQNITFTPNSGYNWYVFCDKRVSPVKFDATRSDEDTSTGQWYMQVKDESANADNILNRYHELGNTLKDKRSKNAYYTRLTDERTAQDRIYRLRYVIPKYAEGVRDPLNGFVLKVRSDTTRKLLPQKIVLAPVASGSPDIATFNIPIVDDQGNTIQQQLGLTSDQLDPSFSYDPYNINSVKTVASDKTTSKVAFSIQSARQVTVGADPRLELTVFDHTITNDALRNDAFVTVRIEAPQNDTFRSNSGLNSITWSGNSTGSGLVQAYLTVPGTDLHYLIIRDVSGSINYNSLVDTTFYQTLLDANNDPVIDPNTGNEQQIFAKLLRKPNSVGSPDESLSKSIKEDYLYSNKLANVLTMTPGDIIEDDTNTSYRVISVEDAGEIEDTFYIFDIDEIQRRIPNQQEGVYYLTCLRGNISPFPTGAGVGQNFRNFKFSQPISQLYPLNYKNDPLWFQVVDNNGSRDETILDVPPTICAADNYVHGLVTTNDYKNSATKEVILDLIENPALSRYEYGTTIKAQAGNATSGSEDRKISISGDSDYPTENKLYVELRRPSIARSGNHTFEYLGFGPGNYSTGFPLRQEVVLEDIQDFYAQSKKEDGGIVFYTGLNSNGDLYIGNRKINAITGEETFLEQATLNESDDEGGDLGNLVTTFELPVVFEKEITVDGDAVFNNPVSINVEPSEGDALTIFSNMDTNAGDDGSLDSNSFALSDIPSEGNITLGKNRIYSAIYALNPRGNELQSGQNYSIRTHIDQTNADAPSNIWPDQTDTIGTAVQFGADAPISGDILLKGREVNKTGSLGWIFSNFYADVSGNILTVQVVSAFQIEFVCITGTDTDDLGITGTGEIRLSGFGGVLEVINGVRGIFSIAADKRSFRVQSPVEITPTAALTMPGSSSNPDNPNAILEVGTLQWKEFGVLGSEAVRTNTDEYGLFGLGINTLARADHADAQEAFTSTATQPRATLDVVGNTFISGKVLPVGDWKLNSTLGDRTFNGVANALLVGGDSTAPSSVATLRVSTQDDRVGINADGNQLDRALVVYGNARITDDLRLQSNLEVNGGNLTTTSTSFNFGITNVTNAVIFSQANNFSLGNTATGPQILTFGFNPTEQEINIGTYSPDTRFNLHTRSEKSYIKLGTVGNDEIPTTAAPKISVVELGGGYLNDGDDLVTGSVFKVYNRYVEVDGDLRIGSRFDPGSGTAKLNSNARVVEMFSLNTSRLSIGASAGDLEFGAKGGTTTINNSLVVEANGTVKGDFTHSGGLNTGQYEIRRGSFSTATQSHDKGSIDNTNLDLYSKVTIDRTLDTGGLGVWSLTEWKVDPTDSEEDEYYLPIGQVSSTIQFEIGAYILIDRSVEVTGQNTTVSPVGEEYSELLLVTGLTNLNDQSGNKKIQVKVRRAQNNLNGDGSLIQDSGQASGYKFLRDDHPDNAVLIRYNLSENVSFITNGSGLPNSAAGTLENLTTGVFSGTVKEGDFFRLSGTELAFLNAINVTNPQMLKVTDGNTLDVFTVESTTGDTMVLGDLDIYANFFQHGSNTPDFEEFVIFDGDDNRRFTIDTATGNTKIFGNLNIGNTQDYDRLTIASDTGDQTMRGGDLLITGDDLTENRLFLQNSTGNLTISGLFVSEDTEGENIFNTDLVVNGDNFTVNKVRLIGGVLTPTEMFKTRWINADTNRPEGAAINFAGQEGFFTQTGARKWQYIQTGTDVVDVESNVNYFIAPTADTVIKLPPDPLTGDMIRIVDVGGNLTYNVSLKFRAPNGTAIQADDTNAGGNPNPGTEYENGGELVVQTPNAGLGLVYIGSVNYDGTTTGAPSSQQGWWLMEI